MTALVKIESDGESRARVLRGDCWEVMRGLIAEGVTVHAVICDPPYHLQSITERWSNASAPSSEGAYARASRGFMGKSWDGGDVSFQPRTWQLALMLLRPGGYLLAFGGTRTHHRIACAIEDAGAEIVDTIAWLYGSGFPKSHNQAGAWKGWGSALKPAFEPIIVARRPSELSIESNLARHGCGALNIDGCRVPVADAGYARNCSGDRGHEENRTRQLDAFTMTAGSAHPGGRWPANVAHDGAEDVLAAFARHGSDKGAAAPVTRRGADKFRNSYGKFEGQNEAGATFRGDTGSAARFFYCAKASQTERAGSKHPTIKPLALMRWLCRLVTPPGGTILDPFAGSGSTGVAALQEGFRPILIERETEYFADAMRRLDHAERESF